MKNINVLKQKIYVYMLSRFSANKITIIRKLQYKVQYISLGFIISPVSLVYNCRIKIACLT